MMTDYKVVWSSSRQPEPVTPTPTAWMREWDGDVSDLGHMIFETEESETHDGKTWSPLYSAEQLALYVKRVHQLEEALSYAMVGGNYLPSERTRLEAVLQGGSNNGTPS